MFAGRTAALVVVVLSRLLVLVPAVRPDLVRSLGGARTRALAGAFRLGGTVLFLGGSAALLWVAVTPVIAAVGLVSVWASVAQLSGASWATAAARQYVEWVTALAPTAAPVDADREQLVPRWLLHASLSLGVVLVVAGTYGLV